MEEFIQFILQFGSLNQQQLALVVQKGTTTTLPKGAYFIEAGTATQQVGFVVEGVLRVCYYTSQGEEITRYFIGEQHLMLDVRGIEHGVASPEYVQAVTDCQLVVFSKRAWLDLSHTIIGWDELMHKISSKLLIQKLERLSPQVNQDAATRYQTFLEKFPQLANRVPLAYLASYLGITQSTLSRIRKNSR